MLGDWSSSAGVRAGGDSRPPDDGASLHRPGARSWTHSQTERGRWAGMRKGKSESGGHFQERDGLGQGPEARGHLHGAPPQWPAWRRSGRPVEPSEELQCGQGALGNRGRGPSGTGARLFRGHQDPSESPR